MRGDGSPASWSRRSASDCRLGHGWAAPALVDGSPSGQIRSIAVLPLENSSGDPEQEYFADGMTEQLIADLATIGALRVISRDSVMHYKAARKPCRRSRGRCRSTPSSKGSIVRAGEPVRITARTDPGRDGRDHLGAEFRRELRECWRLPREVARAITSIVDIRLTAAGAGAPGECTAGRSRGPSASAAGPSPRRQRNGGRTAEGDPILRRRYRQGSCQRAWPSRSGRSLHGARPASTWTREKRCRKRSGPPRPRCVSMRRSPTRTRRWGTSISCTTGTDRPQRRRSCVRSTSIRRLRRPV